MYQIQSTQKLPLQLHNWRLAFSFMLQTQSKEKGPFILHQKITNLRKNIVQNTRYYIWIGLSCLLPRMVNRASLKRAKLEFKTQSCVFWVLFMYKDERKKIEIPEMGEPTKTSLDIVRIFVVKTVQSSNKMLCILFNCP